MAEMTTKDREKLRASQFAYVDRAGGEHLPINDQAHVRNAIARFGQTEFESRAAKERARRKIVAAAKRHGIELSEDSEVAQTISPPRTSSTKAGRAGGRKQGG